MTKNTPLRSQFLKIFDYFWERSRHKLSLLCPLQVIIVIKKPIYVINTDETSQLVSSNHTLLIFNSRQSNDIGKSWLVSFSRMKAYRLKGSVKISLEITTLPTVSIHTFEPNLRTCNSCYALEIFGFLQKTFFLACLNQFWHYQLSICSLEKANFLLIN